MKPLPDSRDDEIDEAAAAWLFEREEGFSESQARDFTAWLDADPRHSKAFRDAEQALELLEELPVVRSELEGLSKPRGASELPLEKSRSSAVRNFVWLGGIAAALLIVFGLWQLTSDRAVLPAEHYATDHAVQQSMVLADSSLMDLNVNSEVAVQFTPEERRIQLHKGQAHFQVSHNPDQPFVVVAGDVSVRAVGTAFSVKMENGEVDITVVEGKVALERKRPVASAPVTRELPLLEAGQRAEFAKDSSQEEPKIKGLDAQTLREVLAWQSKVISFTDVPLIDAIARINRYSGVQLELADKELGARKIGGKIAADQVDAFVRLLESDGEIVADRRAPGVIVLHQVK